MKSSEYFKGKIQVVMAVYNGEEFIDAQISSILGQLPHGEILIHDDGSNDDTNEIINNWSRLDKRVKVLDSPPKGGVVANFSYLLEQTDAEYVFCSDQDDIWQAGKVETMIKNIELYEYRYGKDYPLLLHSDLSIINAEGSLISSSMFNFQNLDKKWGEHFNLLLTQNVVTGCTILVNRSLLRLALPIPKNAVMHDHWLALVACGAGKVEFVNEPLVLYRQHGYNVVGAYSYNLKFLFTKIKSRLNKDNFISSKSVDADLYLMAHEYAIRYKDTPTSSIARKFSSLKQYNLLFRFIKIIQERFYRKGLWRNISWILRK